MKKQIFKNCAIFVFILSCIYLQEPKLYAQINCVFQCDTTAYWTTIETMATVGLDNDSLQNKYNSGILVRIKYKIRYCNGVKEIIIENKVLLDNSKHFDSLKIDEYNYNVVDDFVNLYLIEASLSSPAGVPNPLCPDSSEVIILYSSSCGVWLKCSYETVPSSRMCDSGFTANYPEYMENGVENIDILKWQPCGYVCCQKIYSVCKKVNPSTSHETISIKQVRKQRNPQTPNCTLQNQFKNGKPPYNSIPCQDGC